MKSKPIARVPWEDVEVDVRDFLAGGFAVREEEVHSFASEARTAETCCRSLADPEQFGAVVGFEVREVGRVRSWDDEHVAFCDRLDVHQCDCARVFVHDGHVALSPSKPAEQAVARFCGHAAILRECKPSGLRTDALVAL